MSRASVYEGLKNAIKYRNLPYHHFEDDYCTIAFESWEQYGPFDSLLDSLPTPDYLKLNIYAEKVNGKSDGVAVTVSDEIQRLGYWQMYFDMESKVAELEGLLSALYRRGIQPWSYDYYCFTVTLSPSGFELIEDDLVNGNFLKTDYYVSEGRGTYRMIHLCFPDWK